VARQTDAGGEAHARARTSIEVARPYIKEKHQYIYKPTKKYNSESATKYKMNKT